MAAYAALVSVTHIIDNLRLHCRPPITLHKQQAHLLTQNLNFLLEFLQVYNPKHPYSKEADPLESRIARAAYAAEDAIESHIADQFTNNDGEKMSSDGLYEALEKVIEDMALIQKEAMEIKESARFQNQLHTKSTPSSDSSSTSATSSTEQKKSKMVGADDLLLELKDKLTADARGLQTIPIVGMGGSGKTTLALNIYQDALIKEHFDIHAWITISQEYSIREILVQFLTQLIKDYDQKLSEGDLGEMLHKHLYGRKYMIVLDDMWSLEAWDGVRRFLPNHKNGSRIVITTRLTTLASALSNSNSLGMKLLDDDDSWDLLSKTVFGEKGCCPSRFEEIGKKIGKSCKGLPLLIVVVGGLLAKSAESIESWKHVDENLKAIVNLEDDERCLNTLYMSYKQLPVHLKPCFLYMGIYREDHKICISKLVRLWVVEGFLKSVSGQRLEDVARMYLKELIDRNLIMIHRLGSIGGIKYCKVHDLLRDLCLREAQKEGFYDVYQGQGTGNRVSRILLFHNIPDIEGVEALSSVPLARSLVLDLSDQNQPPHIFRLLRIFGSRMESEKFLDNVHQLVNSRSLNFTSGETTFPNLIWLFWNLQTVSMALYGAYDIMTLPTEIWYMSHIRHLYFGSGGMYLPDPPLNVESDGIVLENLQSLGIVYDFKCSEQVIKRIPNIRKLRLIYSYRKGVDDDDMFCLTNLDRLDKLESLHCTIHILVWRMNFPQSLKKLAIEVQRSHYWEDVLDKIGDLPLLQKLKLTEGSFKERHWETNEGQFRSLKFLAIHSCEGLKVWTSEASHFPRLEILHLVLVSKELEEIPSDFADISTLREIYVDACGDSAVKSAYRILKEQEELYGEEETTLQVQVQLYRTNDRELVKSFSSPNFHFTWRS